MNEPSTTDAGAATTDGTNATADTGSTYTPPATQAELDKIVTERLNRQKSQFKDFDTYKAAAAELEQIKAANQTEAERLTSDLNRWQTEAETWRKAAVGNRIEALASTDFADPSDAISALSGTDYLDAGGQIDEARIRADLAEVLERKPHWRRPEGQTAPASPRNPAPNAAQGSGGGRPVADPAAEFASILQGQLNRS
jgi:hypothetical protein